MAGIEESTALTISEVFIWICRFIIGMVAVEEVLGEYDVKGHIKEYVDKHFENRSNELIT